MSATTLMTGGRIPARRESGITAGGHGFEALMGEVLQVLKGALVPISGPAPELPQPLRRDLGLV